MDLTIPATLKSLSAAGSAIKELTTWWKKANGDSRALIGELKDNLSYLDMVAEDGLDLSKVIDSISVSEYKRLSRDGFNFNTLKKGKIAQLTSLERSD